MKFFFSCGSHTINEYKLDGGPFFFIFDIKKIRQTLINQSQNLVYIGLFAAKGIVFVINGMPSGNTGFLIVGTQCALHHSNIKVKLNEMGEVVYAINTCFHYHDVDRNKVFGSLAMSVVAHQNERIRIL